MLNLKLRSIPYLAWGWVAKLGFELQTSLTSKSMLFLLHAKTIQKKMWWNLQRLWCIYYFKVCNPWPCMLTLKLETCKWSINIVFVVKLIGKMTFRCHSDPGLRIITIWDYRNKSRNILKQFLYTSFKLSYLCHIKEEESCSTVDGKMEELNNLKNHFRLK